MSRDGVDWVLVMLIGRRNVASGLTTLADVRTHTKASASCGSCTGLVEKLLMLSLGEPAVQKK